MDLHFQLSLTPTIKGQYYIALYTGYTTNELIFAKPLTRRLAVSFLPAAMTSKCQSNGYSPRLRMAPSIAVISRTFGQLVSQLKSRL
jgi:hypothetical protein